MNKGTLPEALIKQGQWGQGNKGTGPKAASGSGRGVTQPKAPIREGPRERGKTIQHFDQRRARARGRKGTGTRNHNPKL